MSTAPERLLDIAALTAGGENPTYAVQWSVVDNAGQRHIFGDQSWVRDGRVLDEYPGGRVEHRHLTISYSQWASHDHQAPDLDAT